MHGAMSPSSYLESIWALTLPFFLVGPSSRPTSPELLCGAPADSRPLQSTPLPSLTHLQGSCHLSHDPSSSVPVPFRVTYPHPMLSDNMGTQPSYEFRGLLRCRSP